MRAQIICLAVTALAAGAHADTFSAFSDRNPDGPTVGALFDVPSLAFRDGAPFDGDGIVRFGLDYDLNGNLPGGEGSVNTRFSLEARLSSYQRVTLGAVVFHTYRASGVMRFISESTGNNVLAASFENAAFSSISNESGAWGQTATLVADDTFGSLLFQAGDVLAGRTLTQSRDLTLNLANVRGASGGRVLINTAGAALASWMAEASFTAHAVPTPGAAVALGLGGLVALRRRRS